MEDRYWANVHLQGLKRLKRAEQRREKDFDDAIAEAIDASS